MGIPYCTHGQVFLNSLKAIGAPIDASFYFGKHLDVVDSIALEINNVVPNFRMMGCLKNFHFAFKDNNKKIVIDLFEDPNVGNGKTEIDKFIKLCNENEAFANIHVKTIDDDNESTLIVSFGALICAGCFKRVDVNEVRCYKINTPKKHQVHT